MRVFLFAFALSSFAISSILAKPFFNVEDSKDGNIMFQLDSDFNGLEKEFLQPSDLQASIGTIYNRGKREDDTNKTKAQKGIPTFNEIPNIQKEKSDLDLIHSNKLSSSGNTNQHSQTGFPIFQGVPNFSGILNVPKIPNIPNILNSENNQSGSSASLNFPNIFSNLPSVPQFQSKIDVPINSNLQNGIPNFFGNQNLHGIPNLQNGIANLQNGIANLPNGIANLANGIANLPNGIANLQNGIPNLQNGIQSLQNGIPNLQKGISDLQNGLSNYFNPDAHFGIHTQLRIPKFTVNGLPNLPFGFDLQQALKNFNLTELEAMYNKLKTEAENHKNNNFLQEMLRNFDRFLKGVRDFFGNMTGGLTTRVSDDFNKFISNVFPFGNRN